MSRKAFFLLDNSPLRVLALKGNHPACDASNLISILTKKGLFSSSGRLLLPVFVTLEFLGVSTLKLPRPEIDVDSFGPSLAERMQGVFDQAYRFFDESSALSQQRLIGYWFSRNRFRLDSPWAEEIFRSVWDRILKPDFRKELCQTLAAEELGRTAFGEFKVQDSIVSDEARSVADYEMQSNTEILRCLLELRERLGISIPVARIGNRICGAAFRPDIRVSSKKGKKNLVALTNFRSKEDGADMEYIDYSILGHRGRPVICVTFDDFNQVAVRMVSLRHWYKRFLARHRKVNSLANIFLIDGLILQITDNQVRRISLGLLSATDIPFEGL